MEELVRTQFNQILVSQYERLTGSKNVPGGLPSSLNNIVFFILFGARELEMADYTSEISERYTQDEFLAEVRDMGIPEDEYFTAAMQELVEKKYIELLPDGHFYGYQDCKETARVLNRIFPKMQGINLLAYIWQTVAEVLSGRTDLESALSRFDQTLSIQGVLPPKAKIPAVVSSQKPAMPRTENKKESGLTRRSNIIRDYVVADVPVKAAPTAADNDLSDSMESEPSIDYRELFHEEITTTVPNKNSIDQNIQEEALALKQKIAELERSIAESQKDKNIFNAENVMPAKEEDSLKIADEHEDGTPADDEIANKIAAFEQELALVCPVCKTGVLQEKTTAAGKMFYACESRNCNFISWGKPHNIPCVRCKNPFLVEVTD
ncbi:MAG: hypothetical protein ABFD50_01085, partial [Smithella sp.]